MPNINGVRYKDSEIKVKKEIIIKYMELGMSLREAAKVADVNHNSVYAWQKKDEVFAELTDCANAKAVGKYVEALQKSADSGNVSAISFFLARRGGDDWSENVDKSNLDALNKLLALLANSGELVPKKPKEEILDISDYLSVDVNGISTK